jgi:uncharacterized membrane protein
MSNSIVSSGAMPRWPLPLRDSTLAVLGLGLACALATPAARSDGGTITAARHEAVADARFWGLDHLPGGQDISYAYGMSYNGGVVAGESFSSISSLHGEGVAWTRTSPDTWLPVGIGLPTYDSLNSPAAGASGNARWLVGRVSFTTPTAPDVDTDAYRWSETDGFELLGLPTGFKLAAATGANAAGNVIAGYGGPYAGYVDLRALAWRRTKAGWVVTQLEDSYHSTAVRVDPSGKAFAGWARSEASEDDFGTMGREAVLWTWLPDGQVERTWLGALPGGERYSMALGLARTKAALLVAGFSGSAEQRPVIWKVVESATIDLIELPLPPEFTAAGGAATAISADGRRVVGNCWGEADTEFVFTICIWNDGQVSRLDETLAAASVHTAEGWWLWSAAGVSADGHIIAGSGTDPDGYDRAWVVELPD